MLGDRREAYYSSVLEDAGPRYPYYDRLSLRVGLDVAFTCDILQMLLSAQFAKYGLSRSTFNVLMILRHGPVEEGMQLHDLGKLLLISRANITGLIDHLEQKNFVTRTVDRADRRFRFARITSDGETLLDKLVPAHHQNMQALLREMTASEKQSLVELLKKMRESLAAGRERAACGDEQMRTKDS